MLYVLYNILNSTTEKFGCQKVVTLKIGIPVLDVIFNEFEHGTAPRVEVRPIKVKEGYT